MCSVEWIEEDAFIYKMEMVFGLSDKGICHVIFFSQESRFIKSLACFWSSPHKMRDGNVVEVYVQKLN